MLTRGQVAKRLGKSIATVRRLEGRELHPRRDAKGVLRFDRDEVEAVAEGSAGDPGRSDWLEDELEARERAEQTARVASDRLIITPADLEERVRVAAAKVVHGEFARRDQELLRREAERAVRERAEAHAAGLEVVAMLESCTEEELAVLAEDPEFSVLLDELAAAR